MNPFRLAILQIASTLDPIDVAALLEDADELLAWADQPGGADDDEFDVVFEPDTGLAGQGH